jgi:hypothetical protein
MPPNEAMMEQQPESPADGNEWVAAVEKTRTATAPGSEYWLP